MSTEEVRLRDGRVFEVPEHAGVDIMIEHLATGRALGAVAGEAVLFWAEVEPGEDDGDLLRDLVRECRRIVDERGR